MKKLREEVYLLITPHTISMSKSPKNDARQLRNLNFDLANYFSNTIVPQLFVDADLILRIFTPPAMKQFDLSLKDVGRNINDVKDNIRYPSIVENIQEVITSKKILEKEIQTTDGRWYQMNMVPYIEYEENRSNGVIITFIEITRRLEILRELEKLNAEHDVLLYALAHDIRQPISTITLLADALKMTYNDKDPERFDKAITTLKRTAGSLNTFIGDFIQDKQQKTEASEERRLNIEEILEDVLLALREEIYKNKINVSTTFNVSEIVFPRNYLRSIAYNLVHNAVKFSDPEKKSEIRIETNRVGEYFVLSVEDNGLGIAEEHQRMIFKKSFRINKDLYGTGMGLYIIKKMIENHNGKIKLESELKKGTSFKVFFPAESFQNN